MSDSQPVFKVPNLFNNLNLNSLSIEHQRLIQQIDQVLPQTQCGLCGHPEGCLPYATAIVTLGESHNQCVPGGQSVTDLIKLDRYKFDELWYGTKNFYVITRYNRSNYYAMAVFQLAQKIKKAYRKS